jgi:hypothetical protein
MTPKTAPRIIAFGVNSGIVLSAGTKGLNAVELSFFSAMQNSFDFAFG